MSRRRKGLNREFRIGSIVIRYSRAIENHIAKHNVKIFEIVRCLEGDFIIEKDRKQELDDNSSMSRKW